MTDSISAKYLPGLRITSVVVGVVCGLLAGLLLLWQASVWQIALASLLLMLLAYWQSKRIKVALFPEIKSQTSMTTSLSPKIQTLLEELNHIETTPPHRLKIGDQLAALGDPRPGVGLNDKGLPDIDWVKIPAGDYLYGEDNKKQTLETFYISRYPITHRQHQTFIDDGGYKNLTFWKNLKKPDIKPARWNQDNRPRETVSWFEAIAFCRWLSQRINLTVNLPTEQQWEKAASGSKGLNYPWGNSYLTGYANINETYTNIGKWHLKQTCAVGVFPHNASPDSVMDMSGNVWEWCLNQYHDTDNISIKDNQKLRVLRGGSWGDYPGFARSAYRLRGGPGGRYNDAGFRVVCSLPSTEH